MTDAKKKLKHFKINWYSIKKGLIKSGWGGSSFLDLKSFFLLIFNLNEVRSENKGKMFKKRSV